MGLNPPLSYMTGGNSINKVSSLVDVYKFPKKLSTIPKLFYVIYFVPQNRILMVSGLLKLYFLVYHAPQRLKMAVFYQL